MIKINKTNTSGIKATNAITLKKKKAIKTNLGNRCLRFVNFGVYDTILSVPQTLAFGWWFSLAIKQCCDTAEIMFSHPFQYF
jgi:hypothetical protein